MILLARAENKVTPVIEKIQKLNAAVKISFVSIELDDFDSVREAADNINGLISKINILINNAGVMAIPNFATNKTGIESQFATNHLGHFLLTALLFPKILAAGEGARIVNLTSDGYMIGPCRFEDYNFKDGSDYDGWSGYGQSKTANILFTRQLATKLASRGILSFAVHPGGKLFEPRRGIRPLMLIPTTVIVGTRIGRNVEDPEAFKRIDSIAMKNTGHSFMVGNRKTIQQGVATTLITALDRRIAEQTGTYWADAKEEPLRDYASSLENAQRLWTLSEKLVGQKFDL